MKKSISLLIIFTLIISLFVMVGCAKEKSNGGVEEKLSVCVVVSSGFGDKSFNDSAKAGAEKLKEDFGIDVKYIECNNQNFKQRMMSAADTSNVVVPVGWEFTEISEVAKEYPDVKFIWVDNVADGIEKLPNLLCITYTQNEGSFLTGYIAAKMTKSGVVGAVGGEDSTTINDFMVGYEQGAKYANEKVKVVKNYAGTYTDPATGKECAKALHDQGADVIFQIAGNTGMGVFQAAKEEKFNAIGVDQDQKLTAPEFDNEIICSMIKAVGNSIYDTIKDYAQNDKWEGGRVWTADMATGYISIVYGDENSTQQVPDAIKAEVEEVAKKIISGEIKVDTTRE